MAKSKASLETEALCGSHIKGDKEETIDVTALSDTTQLNIPADGTNSASSTLTPSHGVEKAVNTNTIGTNEDSRSGQQELIRMCLQEPNNKKDAESTTLGVQTTAPIGTRTEIGCAETMQDHHAVGYKREHSHSPERQSSQRSSELVAITCTCTCTAAGCLVEPQQQLVADGDILHGDRLGEETQPRKRLRFDAMEGEEGGDIGSLTSREAPGTQTTTLPPSVLIEQDHSTSDPDPTHSRLEATATIPPSPPPATTRGAPHTRPDSLPVSPLPSVSPAGTLLHAQAQHEGGDDGFPYGKEERTPDGGIKEFVGHSYHSPLRNNGEMLTPEKQLPPPNTVTGHHSPPALQRLLSCENNKQCHTYSYAQRHTEGRHTMITRQNSEPTQELYGTHTCRQLYDNNGRLMGRPHT